MPEVDYKKIAEIANAAAENISTDLVTKTIAGVLKTYGMHDPEKTQKVMMFGEACMRDKQNLRRGFFSGVGGHLATMIISISAAIAAIKGLGG